MPERLVLQAWRNHRDYQLNAILRMSESPAMDGGVRFRRRIDDS